MPRVWRASATPTCCCSTLVLVDSDRFDSLRELAAADAPVRTIILCPPKIIARWWKPFGWGHAVGPQGCARRDASQMHSDGGRWRSVGGSWHRVPFPAGATTHSIDATWRTRTPQVPADMRPM
jgi:hypothetical protein